MSAKKRRMNNQFTHGSLFSGIGGFDLAAEWMGWQNMFHCEWNPFGQRVLKHYWPEAKSYEDITKTDFTLWRGKIKILTGGFPCQPYSTAGKRKGKEDERHLWPEMLRAIREIQPSYVVGENVHGLLTWNGGLVFHEVQLDLEAQGYCVQPVVLPAAAIGAPHRRDRAWFVAYSNNFLHQRELEHRGHRGEKERSKKEYSRERQASHGQWIRTEFSSGSEVTSNSNSIRPQRRSLRLESEREAQSADQQSERCHFLPGQKWQEFPTQSPVCNGDDGLSARLDRITFSKWRQESIKAGGNAIVPQVAFAIFKAIAKMEQLKQNEQAA